MYFWILPLWLIKDLSYLILLDFAAMQFTAETPKVFCGLKNLTHLSIGKAMSR